MRSTSSSPAGARSWCATACLAFAALGCAHAAPVPCEALDTMPGPEDFDRLPPRGATALLVSSVERRGETRDTATGSLLLVDAASGRVEPLPLLGRDTCSFRPHGLATVRRDGGAWEAFVVVHHGTDDVGRPGCEILRSDDPPQLDSVERYRVEDDGLRFVERLTDPRMTNLNDVDAAPDGRLWVSNNPAWSKPSQLVADLLLGRRRGQVLLYRPVERSWSVAAERMLYPNGVAVDATGESLHVAGARGKLRHFALDGVGEADDRPVQRGRARGTLDNLMWDDDGALWTTGHPSGLAFLRHVKDAGEIAPTEVYRVTPHPRRERRLAAQRVLRVDDGRVDAGSVALPIGDAVAIGQVFDPGVMLCRP
jgi:hypothetical protein